jgi:hypothetical protein
MTESNREDRLRRAQEYARFQAKKLKDQGYESKAAWPIAIAKAADVLCGPFSLAEFKRDLAKLFRANYWKKVTDLRSDLL